VADLPEGQYTAGFAFAERNGGTVREVAWYDKLASFRIDLPRSTPSVGYASLTTTVACDRVADRIVQIVADDRGTICTQATVRDLVVGEALSLPVVLVNKSAQDWVSLCMYPINLSYRWLDDRGTVVVGDGLRTPLPNGELRAGERVAAELTVQAPDHPGRYTLCALPVQELIRWFDGGGFIPLKLDVTVAARDAATHVPVATA